MAIWQRSGFAAWGWLCSGLVKHVTFWIFLASGFILRQGRAWCFKMLASNYHHCSCLLTHHQGFGLLLVNRVHILLSYCTLIHLQATWFCSLQIPLWQYPRPLRIETISLLTHCQAIIPFLFSMSKLVVWRTPRPLPSSLRPIISMHNFIVPNFKISTNSFGIPSWLISRTILDLLPILTFGKVNYVSSFPTLTPWSDVWLIFISIFLYKLVLFPLIRKPVERSPHNVLELSKLFSARRASTGSSLSITPSKVSLTIRQLHQTFKTMPFYMLSFKAECALASRASISIFKFFAVFSTGLTCTMAATWSLFDAAGTYFLRLHTS